MPTLYLPQLYHLLNWLSPCYNLVINISRLANFVHSFPDKALIKRRLCYELQAANDYLRRNRRYMRGIQEVTWFVHIRQSALFHREMLYGLFLSTLAKHKVFYSLVLSPCTASRVQKSYPDSHISLAMIPMWYAPVNRALSRPMRKHCGKYW